MKHARILRVFGVALLLAMLTLTMQVVPALAVNDVTLSPVTGKINDIVYVSGTNFNAYIPDATYEYYANIYFAKDNVNKNTPFTGIHTYNMVETLVPIYDSGSSVGAFDAAFTIPASLTDGTVDANVTPGTYYVYVTITRVLIAPPNTETVLPTLFGKSPAFTITAAATLDPLSPATGPAGTDITVSGANFPASTALVFIFDTTTITPKSGHTQTTSGGLFLSVIPVPAGATAGAHTITVTAGSGTVTATFNVTASATLNPLTITSGPAGTDVSISGSNFIVSYPIIFKFDGVTISPKSGDANTSTIGSFTSVITVPPGAAIGVRQITVTVGTVTVSTNFTVTANAVIDVSPESGQAGTNVYITGAYFPASLPLVFKIDSTTLIVNGGDSTTSAAGGFYSIITVPAGTASGDHIISVTAGTITLSATFTVTGEPTPTPTSTPTPTPTPTTAINIVQNDFNVGAPIGIGGAGFAAGSTVTIKYGGVTRASATVEANGTFQVIFNIPAIQPGARQFTISDGINTTTANFVVETTAPAEPPLISPDPGVKIKIPVTFDWDNVTDASSPVTYDFQIATDEDFTAGSIILEKTALTDSVFMLTEAEGLELASDTASYFWRVKSVDGALNESDWSAASDFLSSGPSVFPRWALILIIVLGSVFVFGLGFFIGRRTAYYY